MFHFALIKITAIFAATNCTSLQGGSFFGLPHWWEYMPLKSDGLGGCTPVFNGPSSILPIGLAGLDIMLRVAGMVAVVAIILSGLQYITAVGDTAKGTEARKRLTDSLIGLGIVIAATATVTFVGNQLT